MNPGLMDRLVTVQQYTANRSSDTGAEAPTWATLLTTPAYMKIGGGNESVLGDRRENTANVTWTIPYDFNITQVTEKMRVVYNSENYNIIQVEEIGRRQHLKLYTTVVRN